MCWLLIDWLIDWSADRSTFRTYCFRPAVGRRAYTAAAECYTSNDPYNICHTLAAGLKLFEWRCLTEMRGLILHMKRMTPHHEVNKKYFRLFACGLGTREKLFWVQDKVANDGFFICATRQAIDHLSVFNYKDNLVTRVVLLLLTFLPFVFFYILLATRKPV